MFCKSCGKELSDNTLVCPFCETPTKTQQQKKTGSGKSLAVIISALIIIIGMVITAVLTDGFGLLRKDTGEDGPTGQTESSTCVTEPTCTTKRIV